MKIKSIAKRFTLLVSAILFITLLITAASIFLVIWPITVLSAINTIIIVSVMWLIVMIGGVYLLRYMGNIFYHIGFMARGIGQIGTKGDLNFPSDVMESAQHCASWDNEIGVVARAAGSLIQHLMSIENSIASISEGDLSVNVDILSENDVIGNSLEKMVQHLNAMFDGISHSGIQVADGSRQIADGAHLLAQGAAEQASSIEGLSSTLNSISTDTKERVASGTEMMIKMVKSVEDIKQASNEISSIIKVIDDIAFQTNILALNASVEAARAGAHGKGFAVVAEEVKNLANRSQPAARETNQLIANSLKLADTGTEIAHSTQSALDLIVTSIDKLSDVMDGIDRISQVVQRNSATAEESAGASEEMKRQSAMLQELVMQFKIEKDSSAQLALPASRY